jgi:DNA-binding transcriptional LysR family regulator
MDIRDIRYFEVIAKHGNIGRAAEVLELSATALTKSIRRLERFVGTKIFQRTPKGVELTAAGAALINQATKLHVTLEDIRRQAADLGAGHKGHIRAGFSVGLCEYCVTDAFAELRTESPEVSLNAKAILGRDVVPLLRSGEVDFVVRTTSHPLSADFVTEELFRDDRVVYAGASHPLAARKRVTLAELANEDWASQEAPITWREVCRIFEAARLAPPRRILISNSLDMRLDMMEKSRLVMCSSRAVVSRAQQRYDVVELPVREFSIERRVGVSIRKDGYLSPASRRMIEILKEQGRAITAGKTRGVRDFVTCGRKLRGIY